MKEHYQIGNKGKFRPRARIIRTLGNELISSETVAIIELVKNAYDADATRVTVSFIDPVIKGSGVILIADNGLGMTTETVLNTWMEPATDFRKHQRRSEYLNRRVVGEKGIGRFAASKIALLFEMVTRRINTDVETRVFFDWSQFDDESKYLDQIELNWELDSPKQITTGGQLNQLINIEGNFSEQINHGTILRLESLTTTWDEEKIRILRTGLARLISPFRNDKDPNPSDEFDIYLNLPNRLQQFNGKVAASETMQFPHYLLKGDVNDEGKYKITIQLNGEEPIFVENNSVFEHDEKSSCGPFKIELRVWDRDRDSLMELVEKSKGTIIDMRRDLDDLAGINIYRDGFRILPYGEPRNDWLRLDMRRVQNPTKNLSNNQIVGYIMITSEENPDLRDQSNREGIIESKAFDDFRKIIISIMTELEGRRYQKRHPKHERTTPGIFANLNINAIASYARKNYSNDVNLLSIITKNKEQLNKGIDEVQGVLSRYWRLATLGNLIDTVLHDGRTPLTKIKNELVLTLGIIEEQRIHNEQYLESVKTSIELMQNQTEVLSTVFNRIEPFSGRKRGEPNLYVLEEIIKIAFEVLSSEIIQTGVKISLPDSKTSFYLEPSELQEIIINLLNNSLFWLKKVSKYKREIIVLVSAISENKVIIIFSDSGPGIPEEFREEIFQPYFSLKPNGVGLGLTIVGDIITEYYSGEMELIENGPLPGATFRITMEWRK